MKKNILTIFLSMAIITLASAQNNPNRVYTTKMTAEVIAAYEMEKAPKLVAAWLNTTDAATRHGLEVELSSFTHIDEPTALRMRPLGLDTKVFAAEEVRLVHFKRDIYFYQQLGETENLYEAREGATAVEKVLANRK